MGKKLTTEEFIEKAIKIHGDRYGYSKVVYVLTKIPIIVMCEKHGEFSQLPNSHLQGQGCPKCSNNIVYSLQAVRHEFEKEGCKLLEATYVNNKAKLRYCCSCGNVSKIAFTRFRTGQRCKACGIKKRVSVQKLSFDFIKTEFEKTGCRLLSTEYKGTHVPLDYQCSCGNISKIEYNSFRKGTTCKLCASKRNSGKNSYQWNSSTTDKEREQGRSYPEYKQWRKEVYERDNYECQKCGEPSSGKLHAHHIIGYGMDRTLRVAVENGITLCENCHMEFHNMYTRVRFTPEDFAEFMEE